MATKLAKLLAKNLKKQKLIGFGPLTLMKVTPGTRTPGAVSGGTNPTTTNYPCKGRLGTKRTTVVQGGALANVQLLTISILGATLSDAVDPAPGDKIVRSGVTYLIVSDGVTNPDGLRAIFDCAVRQL